MLWILFILIGLSLDSAVVMMNKGAQLTSLNYGKTIWYALIYAAVSFVVFSLGFGLATVLDPYAFTARTQSFMAVLVVMCIGVWIVTRSFNRGEIEERADRDFCVKTLIRIAAVTNIDTFIVGGCVSFYGMSFFMPALNLAGVTFLVVLASLRAGYSLGAGHQKIIGIIGGSLIIVFSIYLGLLAFILR